MDDLIAEFIAETREMLDALGGEIVAWEADPDDRARLDAIFRFVHTVKGNTGFFDLPRLEALSHAAEDALSDVRSGKRHADSRLVSAVLAVIDRIGEMVGVLESGEALAEGSDDALIAGLSAADDAAFANIAVTQVASQARPLRTVRLPVDLLDRLMSGVSDLVLARNELVRRLRDAPLDGAVQVAVDALSAQIAEMRDAITRTRMQRLEGLFAAIPRMVRDLAAELGKQVVAEIEGGDVELDREMIESIRDPLTHIIRNAVDHGIEAPAVRAERGKRPVGLLRITARQSGNQILIEIGDDGAGIDGDRLVDRALAAGMLRPEHAAKLAPAERIALVFGAGVSTAAAVTSISGRGVGMDVVRANVERIGGTVAIDSRLGFGTGVTMRVPLTLTIIAALVVGAGGQGFAVPRAAIEEIIRAEGTGVRIEEIGGAGMVTIRGERMPLLRLGELLNLPCSDGDRRNEDILLVLRSQGRRSFALAVDEVGDHQELVIKPAAPSIMATGLYAGTTLADSGQPILLLDPAGLAEAGGLSTDARGATERMVLPVQAAEVPRVLLFRALGGERRGVPLAAVDRIEEVPATAARVLAGRLRVQLGDRLLDLLGCEAGVPGPKLHFFRMSDGRTEIAYAFADIIDIVASDGSIAAAAGSGEVAGVLLIGGQPTEMIDPHHLLAAATPGAGPASTTAPLCVIPAGDPWMNGVLRPLVEAAGYRVLAGANDEETMRAVAIFASDAHGTDDDPRIVRLHDGAPGESADSMARYDRGGILQALAARSGGRP